MRLAARNAAARTIAHARIDPPLLSGAIATTPQKALNRRPKKRSVEPRGLSPCPRRSGKLESLEVFIAGALHPPLARPPVSIGKQRSPGCSPATDADQAE